MPLTFSAETKHKIEALKGRYPSRQAACLPVLHLAQDEFGWISDEAVDAVAEALQLPAAHVYGVATFYTMYHRHPTGKHTVMVCTNIACMLRGGYDVLDALVKRTGVPAGGISADGEFTIVEEECLAACANAPCMISGQKYFLDLTPDAAVRALDEIKRMPPDHAPSRGANHDQGHGKHDNGAGGGGH
jgi:NADH-quinone oxidoreductase E subunit